MIKLVNVSKVYLSGAKRVEALKNICFSLAEGGSCAIVGHSGSGKTTLLNILGCLDTPTSGDYYLCGRRVDKAYASFARREKIGFVFQSFDLIPDLTALQNTELPLTVRGVGKKERVYRAQKALESVGLSDRTGHYPAELSGGQKQRAAIARALIKDPDIILADEPCGNLDPETSKGIMDILIGCRKTFVLITHDLSSAARVPEIIKIENGEMYYGTPRQKQLLP